MYNMYRTNIQSGRSMIEMLGVLAIIGVLSVGGIAGYSKAMMKFKINKTIDQVSQLSQNTRTLYVRQKNYGSLGGKVIYKANLAPREMFESGSGSGYEMTNAFGGDVQVYSHGKYKFDDNKAFMIILKDIPEEACIELATQDWGGGEASGLIAVSAGTDGFAGNSFLGGDCYGDSACPSKSGTFPMPVDVAVEHCAHELVAFKFY